MPVIPYDQKQLMVLPYDLNEWATPKHPARLISDIIDRADTSSFRTVKPDGRPCYNAKLLLKIIIWGYANAVRASRKIEAHLSSDVIFMWLAGLLKPDFRTICTFRRHNEAAIDKLFLHVLLVVKELGLRCLGVIALDGTKIRASAGINSFKKKSEWRKELARLKEEVGQALAEAEALDQAQDRQYGSDRRGDEVPDELQDKQQRIEQIELLLKVVEEVTGENTLVSTTDADARFMHTSKGSMPAYNVQLAVSADQIIVHADVTTEPVDVNQVVPALNGIEQNCGAPPAKLLADTGYSGGKNLRELEARAIDAYIPESAEKHIGQRRLRDPQLFSKAEFRYAAEQDCYHCPAGERLSFVRKAKPRGKYSQKELLVYRAAKGVCLKCPLKAQCTRTESRLGRSVTRDGYEAERERMRQKLDTEAGKKVYGQRKCLSEPTNGQIKVVNGLRQFLLRGKAGVRVETKWTALTHNLLKVVRRMLGNDLRPAWA